MGRGGGFPAGEAVAPKDREYPQSVFPEDADIHVSHKTTYTAIYAQPRGELRHQLIACLRHGRSTHMQRARGTYLRGQISDLVSTHMRSPEADDRAMPSHWEGAFTA